MCASFKSMRDAGYSIRRFARKSVNFTNATPIYISTIDAVVVAADKNIRAISLKTGHEIYQVPSHADSISDIFVQDNKIVSCGLDGKIFTYDIDSGQVLSKHELHKPISRLVFNKTHYVAVMEHGNRVRLNLMDSGFENRRQLFPGVNVKKIIDMNNHFVAVISGTSLYLHWLIFEEYTRYDLPVHKNKAVSEYKQLTCVACHPNELVVATGNALGEVMIWWNFTGASSANKGDCDNDMYSDSDEDENDKHHFSALKSKVSANTNTALRLLHPMHVKRSVMHWHSSIVTALSFTGEGKQLYSGGLEGVLVKWDLTDSFGEVKNRRFLSMLNSPIQAISSPGGLADSHVVVTLERNSIFVIDGALQVVYKHDGLDQIPPRWRSFILPATRLVQGRIAALPITLANNTEDSEESNSMNVLMNGALGVLQLVDCRSGALLDKIDVNQHNYVMHDGLPAPVVSEALLVDSWSAENFATSPWLVTYSELQVPRLNRGAWPLEVAGYSTDSQAQIIWWRWMCDPTTKKMRFQAVFGESIAYLNCPATDLRFVQCSGILQAVLLLSDQRVLFWQYNPKSETLPTQRPWRLNSCISTCPELLLPPLPTTTGPTAPVRPSFTKASRILRVVFDKHQQTGANAFPKTREEALLIEPPRNVLITASETTVKSFSWIQWQSGNAIIDELLPLHRIDLVSTEPWKSSGMTSNGSEESGVAGRGGKCPQIAEIAQLNVEGIADVNVALLIAPPLHYFAKPQKKDAEQQKQHRKQLQEEGSEAPTPSTDLGGLCILRLTNRGEISLKASTFDIKPSGAFAVDKSGNFVALGMADGSCRVYNHELEVVSTFAQIPSFPFCDRALFTKSHKHRTDTKGLVSTLPEALAFLPPHSVNKESASKTPPPLALVLVTKHGRESGRRDLAVFDGTSARAKSLEEKDLWKVAKNEPNHSISQAASLPLGGDRGGILSRVERVTSLGDMDATSGSDLLLPRHRKRRLETDEEVERTLRKVSQYPIDMAPPPEQLLAQLFKKPSSL